jgi:nucleoid-associated protein YgaU
MVKAGDTLPLMTEEIYGDDKYYLEVARINNITSFRQLQPGTEIFFPPIEKVS